MKLTRKEDISLYLYIKDRVISPEFYEVAEAQSLTGLGNNIWEIGNDSDKCPFVRGNCSGSGRGILYFDVDSGVCDFGTEQSNMISVYQGSTQVSGVTVNYLQGQIEETTDLSNYLIDYNWHYVSVVDAWPYDDVPPLPIVSIELIDSKSQPFQLGYGDIRAGYWNVQIFAENKGQRDDLMDVIYEGINKKRCFIYNFENGLPLTKNGVFNRYFSLTPHDNYKFLEFEKVKKSLSGLPQWGFYSQELINRYRAEITFDTIAFKN